MIKFVAQFQVKRFLIACSRLIFYYKMLLSYDETNMDPTELKKHDEEWELVEQAWKHMPIKVVQ